jgi:Uma2 family endonuclease
MASVTQHITVADILSEFGPVPISRVRTNPAPGHATEQDVIDAEVHEDRLFELFDGVLLEKTMGFYESYLASLLGQLLGAFVREHDLGIVAGEAGMLRLCPGQVRIPDVSYVSWSKLPGRRVPREPIPELVPDLAIEVISKHNTEREMSRKLREYFDAGVRSVWYVYPSTRTIRVFHSALHHDELTASETLHGGDILPGFQMPLAQLFADPLVSESELETDFE